MFNYFNKQEASSLGPVVGKIANQEIRANQLLRRGSKWAGGYGTPSDGDDTNKGSQPVRVHTKNAKSLIIYWSRSGSTELLASKLADKLDADIYEVRLQNPYPANYQKTLARANRERETGNPPAVVKDMWSLSQYDTVYFGFQTWAMTLSQPMQGFLKAYGQEFTDKKLAPFETEGGYGQGDSISVFKQLIKEAGGKNNTYTKPLVVDGNKVDQADHRVSAWLKQVN
ncbi:flavodoxin [Lactobacillus nasalidis]|uniref:Flavodoxin n=2 Tax=Lactobacillus nasalidis TaxID=2797258 RepID=A0ABQ3W5Z0_9LACO|nr:flavodoxin [Lactobacillus nasalidis]GHV99392.1 flavodoxin [Lactobacillus nasalidis]GHW01968.1 flavodoxin [Lactobacillus nasalidis]